MPPASSPSPHPVGVGLLLGSGGGEVNNCHAPYFFIPKPPESLAVRTKPQSGQTLSPSLVIAIADTL